jgi:hypothetical protein
MNVLPELHVNYIDITNTATSTAIRVSIQATDPFSCCCFPLRVAGILPEGSPKMHGQEPVLTINGPFSRIFVNYIDITSTASTTAIRVSIQATDLSGCCFAAAWVAGSTTRKDPAEPYPSRTFPLWAEAVVVWIFVITGDCFNSSTVAIPLAVQATDYSKHCKLRCRPLVYY